MLVLGDVFAIVAVLAGTYLTTVAMLLTLALLARESAEEYADRSSVAPAKQFLMGALIGLPMALVSLMMMGSPFPVVKLVGILALLSFFLFSLMGATGLVRLLSNRIRHNDQSISVFRSVVLATLILSGAMMFPFVGWLLVAPITLVTGFGTFLPDRTAASPSRVE